MEEIRFDGQVAVVTGAGRGIGRAYALLLAARGASVVVNDLGVQMSGAGGDATLADDVVAEIRSAGGKAEADGSDITSAQGAAHLIDRAVAAFGGLDIVVNNAGIFGNDQFPGLDVDALRRQFEVHVGGSFHVTRAAWPHLLRAAHPRVVLTSSTSALGAADTVAYGTAKAAVLGLGRSLARAGAPHGIKVNVVAPMAITRMMSTGMGLGEVPPQIPERDPALVAPLVALLCHSSCATSGEIYVSGMRRFSRLATSTAAGYTATTLAITPEVVADHWDEVSTVDLGERSDPALDTMSWSATNEAHLAATPVTA